MLDPHYAFGFLNVGFFYILINYRSRACKDVSVTALY